MEQNDRPEALDWTKALDKARGRKPVGERSAPLPEPSSRPAESRPAAGTPTRPTSYPSQTVKKPGEKSALRPAGLTAPSIGPNGNINRPPAAPKGMVHGGPINPQTASLPARPQSVATQGRTEFNWQDVVVTVLKVVAAPLKVVAALFFLAWFVAILDSV